MADQVQDRQFSRDEFANLGAPRVVYIRPVELEGGQTSFSIHAANGIPLAEDLASFEEAVFAARDNEFQPVSLH